MPESSLPRSDVFALLYAGGTLLQVRLAGLGWGRGGASFQSGHQEIKNHASATPRAPAPPANDPEWQTNASSSGRRRTVTKREFLGWNLRSSCAWGGVVEATSSLETEEQNLVQSSSSSDLLMSVCLFLFIQTLWHFMLRMGEGWGGFVSCLISGLSLACLHHLGRKVSLCLLDVYCIVTAPCAACLVSAVVH